MSRSITITNKAVKCQFCKFHPTKDLYFEFKVLLDKADKEYTNENDKYLMWNGEFDTVDENFYVCQKHMDKIKCDECKILLTRHQIANAIYSQRSEPYNLFREGPRGRDYGSELKPACTDCWLKYDSEIRNELNLGQCNDCKKILKEGEGEKCKTSIQGIDEADEYILCDTCVDKWVCDNCDEYMTYGEIEEYKFEPCGLDYQIFHNQDTEGMPHCDKCYDELKLEKSWAKQAGAPLDWYTDSEEESEEESDMPPKIVACISEISNFEEPKPTSEAVNMMASKQTFLSTLDNEIEGMSYKELSNYIQHTLHIKGEVSKAKNKDDLKEIIRRHTSAKANPIEMPKTYPELPPSPDISGEATGLPCSIVINDEILFTYPLPEGKSQKDLMRHITNFFLDE